MERKLATVLFVDLVDSTGLVATSDPEVVRRRVTRFFEQVAHCIQTHGGTVEKFAGDAVMAAFGIPQAHEDDAERAARAALGILRSIRELGLEARVGIEAGEVVADEADSTFATGEAVNVAARLQQAAGAGEILIGPGAHNLTVGRIDVEELGPVPVRGRELPVWTWRVVGARDGVPARTPAAPFVGREAELDLLTNTWERALRNRRAHLFTIYGEPGVGKSRLVAEFTSALEGATVLKGRALPYGEGITYWPLAEMVKSAAGISDDDPVADAVEKLRACCEDEAVADLLGLASGVLAAVESERSAEEIAWAAREFVEQLASVQPLVMVFEDIHWAEEPLLELIGHLVGFVRDTPLLLLCLARPELLDVYPSWGGGSLRATAIALEPLAPEESEELVEALREARPLPEHLRAAVLEKTEGNPLFLEETMRAIEECGDEIVDRIPETLHALIAARIDRLPPAEKAVLQRAAVIGRTFWGGAIEHLASDVDGSVAALLDALLRRDFVLREPRSSISGERAYRFKHVLIREVAYAGLSKSMRAEQHGRFAEWLRERAGEELLEIRAYHLDHAVTLLEELDGAPPRDLASEAAAALQAAGRRALAREANRSARALLVRSVELEPTLDRRFLAARAARHLADLSAVSVEMELVRADAEAAGDVTIQSRALAALAEVALTRDADVPRARSLAERALAILDDEPSLARYDALDALSTAAWWVGRLREAERLTREQVEIAQALGRKELEGGAIDGLASLYLERLEYEKARELIERANELAEESGSLRYQAWARRGRARLHILLGELDEAQAALEEARDLFEEAGASTHNARTLMVLADVAARRGEFSQAEHLLRDAVKILKPLGERGTLCEVQRRLAQALVKLGKVEEAERVALQARETVGPQDRASRATTRMALGLVRVAQGRDEEAETLLRDAVSLLDDTDFRHALIEPLEALVQFLRERERDDEAAPFERRLLELAPAAGLAASFGASAARIA